MAWLSNVLQLVQVVAALGVVILVLLQHGKGADMGAAFGGGSSGSLFGASGSANFLSRMTGVAATIFFVTTLGLAYLGSQTPQQRGSLLDQQTPATAPASSGIPGTGGVPAPTSPVPGSDANSQIPGAATQQNNQRSDIPK